MQHVWSVLCAGSIVDRDSNNISLLNCIEQLNFDLNKKEVEGKEKIVIPYNFQLINLWFDQKIDTDRNFKIKIEVHDPRNKKISEFENEYSFPKGIERIRVQTKITGILVTIEGVYKYIIKFKTKGQKEYTKAIDIPLELKLNLL